MQRDNFFDNYKAFLILLVVIGHFTGSFTNENHFMNFLVTSIYCFHMPAFVFVSAYFSNRNNFYKLLKTLFLPYLIFQFIYYLLQNLYENNVNLNLLTPKFSLWFLLSLFCWRVFIDKLIKIKGILPLSILAGVLVGFVNSIGAFGALERTITFLPFFILGYNFNKESFMNHAKKPAVKAASAALLAIILTILYFYCDYIDFDVLIMKYSYAKSDILQWGWLYRLFIYMFSSLFIYLLAVVMPKNRHTFTYIGQRTMSIYLLHGIIYKIAQNSFHMDRWINELKGMLMILLLAILLTFILSLKPFDYLVRKLSSLPVEKLVPFQLSKL